MCLCLSTSFLLTTSLFLLQSAGIQFMTVTHLADCQSTTIFKALHGIVLYYFQHGFQVTVVTADGEFASLQECMVELPGVP